MARGYRFGVVGNLSIVPDGSTVLPTDDIQIWLKCASIKGKTYTTLAQVLADSTTLQALITSPNAVDYVVRSTTWASGVTADSGAMTLIGANNYASNTLLGNSTWLNAICNSTYFESVLNAKVPTMTSNTTPSGVASSSTYYNQRQAYKGFDGNTAYPNYWATSSGKGWVQYQFTTSNVLKCVKLLQQVSGTSGWTMEDSSVKVQGSNDGTNFTDIEEITLLSSEATSWKTTSINNSTAYTYIRLDFNAPNMSVSGARYSVVGEAQFYGRVDV